MCTSEIKGPVLTGYPQFPYYGLMCAGEEVMLRSLEGAHKFVPILREVKS